MKSLWFMGLAVCLLLVSACQRKPIERAVRGSLAPVEENVVVTTYCQSCHLHASFQEAPHIEKQKLRFDEKSPLRAANRCLACHIVRPETFFKAEQRSTTFPHGTLVDIAKIPKPKSAPRLKREKSEGPAPKQEAPPQVKKKEPEKKKKRWYFLYLF